MRSPQSRPGSPQSPIAVRSPRVVEAPAAAPAGRAPAHDGLKVPQEARSVLQLVGRAAGRGAGAMASAYDAAANDVCTTDGRSVTLYEVRPSGLRELHHAPLLRPRADVCALVALSKIGCYALFSNGGHGRVDVMRAPFDSVAAPPVSHMMFTDGYVTCATVHRADHELVCAGVIESDATGNEVSRVCVIPVRRHGVAKGDANWCVVSNRLTIKLRARDGRVSALAVDEARAHIVGALRGGLAVWDLGSGR